MAMRELRAPLFRPELLEAIREGRKTQARRVVKPQPTIHGDGTCVWAGYPREFLTGTETKATQVREEPAAPMLKHAPYGQPGDVLGLREQIFFDGAEAIYNDNVTVQDRRTGKAYDASGWKWKRDTLTSMFMPVWAARDFVTVESVRVQRAQDISLRDIKAEGICTRPFVREHLKVFTYREREILKLRSGLGDGMIYTLEECGRIFKVTRERIRWVEEKGMRKLWKCVLDSINPKLKPFENNLYLWAYTFGQYVREPGRAMPDGR